ncbi:quinone-dependent dihydroorotate dehydrogenase [soil metagenome]
MYALARPLLFALDPHAAHALGTFALGAIEHVAWLRERVRKFTAPPASLRREVLGLSFASPIGLAGGFDKNAQRPRSLAALGFGFLELGTVTARAQEENPRPNMFRLPLDHALINRLGFPNEGAAAVAARFAAGGGAKAAGVPVGFSIGKSRVVDVGEDPEPILADYIESFRAVHPVADFVVVNVSSPNTKNLRALQGPALARTLFHGLAEENARLGKKPLLVKIAPDLDDAGMDQLFAVVSETELDGIVATNTTLARRHLVTSNVTVADIGAGGLSGPPVRTRAIEVVRRARAALPKIAIIGVGGVETGTDAKALLDAGADLVQLYTGFIYRGPWTARSIARELASLSPPSAR